MDVQLKGWISEQRGIGKPFQVFHIVRFGDRWMDGRMDERIWMDGWIDKFMDGRMKEYRWMDGLISSRMDGLIYGWKGGRMKEYG